MTFWKKGIDCFSTSLIFVVEIRSLALEWSTSEVALPLPAKYYARIRMLPVANTLYDCKELPIAKKRFGSMNLWGHHFENSY